MNNVNAIYNTNPQFGNQQFNGSINTNGIDFSQYQQQHLADDHQQEGPSPSPRQQHTPFQVSQVVPVKRSHPSEENAVSQLGPGVHHRSRSQTPQHPPYPSFPGQPPTPQFQTPTSMHHMQQSMSPSPAHSHQQYRPPTIGPYNQIQQMNRNNNQQDRMGMPTNAAQQAFMRQNAPVSGPGMSAMGGNNAAASPQANMNQMQAQQEVMRRRYQAHLQQTQQHLQGQLPQMSQPGSSLGSGAQHRASFGQATNAQMPGGPPMSQGPNPGIGNSEGNQEQAFLRSLRIFHQQRSRHLTPEPRVCGHPITYFMLFRRYAQVCPGTDPQQWGAVAAGLGLPYDRDPSIIRELRTMFEQDLQEFYFLYFKAMREKKPTYIQGQQQPGASMGLQGSPQSSTEHVLQSTSPSSLFPNQQQRIFRPPTTHNTKPTLQDSSIQNEAPQGQAMPTKTNTNEQSIKDSGKHRRSGSLFSQIGNAEQSRTDAPGHMAATYEASFGVVDQSTSAVNGLEPNLDEMADANLKDSEYTPRRYPLKTYGGINMESIGCSGGRLHDLKGYLRYEELGMVDLRVIHLCLQSGFEAEENYALEQLAALSQRPLILSRCEELLDTVIEHGQIQARRVLEASNPSPDTAKIPRFDQVTEGSLLEVEAVQTGPTFGEDAYKGAHGMEKLLAVTTILRNLSFPAHDSIPDRDADTNSKVMCNSNVKSLMSDTLKVLAAGPRCFRCARNAQDIMKDVVTLCSNIADSLELASEDEARMFMQFLCSFAPVIAVTADSRSIRFSSFDPVQHHYLSCAVDSLAKLLARDDPNRVLCRAVFNAETSSSISDSSQSLISRAFALAVAPIPDGSGGAFSTNAATHLAGRRRPLLSQAMLVADILSTLLPSSSSITSDRVKSKQSQERIWLESEDAWASRLMRLVVAMAMADSQGGVQRDPVTQTVVEDSGRNFVTITQRALSMLRRLVDRSDKWDAAHRGEPVSSASLAIFGAVPLDEVLFSAVSIPRFDVETMNGLNALASLSRSG